MMFTFHSDNLIFHSVQEKKNVLTGATVADICVVRTYLQHCSLTNVEMKGFS